MAAPWTPPKGPGCIGLTMLFGLFVTALLLIGFELYLLVQIKHATAQGIVPDRVGTPQGRINLRFHPNVTSARGGPSAQHHKPGPRRSGDAPRRVTLTNSLSFFLPYNESKMNSLITSLNTMLGAHSIMVLALAFLAGLICSILPCTIAMLPIIVGYMGAYAEASKGKILLQILFFTLGLALVMTILGVAASLLGRTFGTMVGSGWYYIVGAIAILMALQLLNVFHIPIPQTVQKFPESKLGHILSPLVLGMTFGIASSPCGTPFLAVILSFISREHNIVLGGASLFCYALGQGVLFLVVGMGTGMLKHLAVIRHVGGVMNKLSATVFLIAGVMMILTGAGFLPQIMHFLHLF